MFGVKVMHEWLADKCFLTRNISSKKKVTEWHVNHTHCRPYVCAVNEPGDKAMLVCSGFRVYVDTSNSTLMVHIWDKFELFYFLVITKSLLFFVS